jgi:hypothetical protein
MERGWLETIQILGLDLQFAYVLVLLLMERLATLAGRVTGRVRSRVSAAARRRGGAASEPPADAWPPGAWRPSH